MALADVRTYGASGDGTTNDRESIQRAIDDVTLEPGGGVIYFPQGRYRIDDQPLVLRRLKPWDSISFRGDGWTTSRIVQGKGSRAAWLVGFADEPMNRGDALGYTFQDLMFVVRQHNQAIRFAPTVVSGDESHHKRLTAVFQRVIFRSEKLSSEPLVYIERGSRVRFLQCLFSGVNGPPRPAGSETEPARNGGVAIKLVRTGGATVQDCQTVFGAKDDVGRSYGAGALLDVEGGGEMVVVNCRSEGATEMPAWRFVGVASVTLISPANEGVRESPAIMYFENCKQVVVTNSQIATPNEGPDGTFAHGIMLVACENVRLTGVQSTRAFNVLGDGTSRLIWVDSTCRCIVGEGIRSVAETVGADIELDPRASYSCLEVWYSHPRVRRMVTFRSTVG